MSLWQQRERARVILSKETGHVIKPQGARLRIALAFPNTYWVGMSNLGFQTVYRLFNDQPDISCERVFLPPKQELAELVASRTPLVSLESQSLVGEFDVIAFSVSFEWDYVNVLTLLRLAGVPSYAAERSERHPLVVVGGAVTFVNPEPLAPFADVIAAGEGEVLVPALARAFSEASGRRDLLALLARERGFYIPSFYEPQYASDGSMTGYRTSPGVDAQVPEDREDPPDRLHEPDPLGFAQEADRVALGVAAEAVIVALRVVDVEGRGLFLVEGAGGPKVALRRLRLVRVPGDLSPDDATERNPAQELLDESGRKRHGRNIGAPAGLGKGARQSCALPPGAASSIRC